MLMASPLLAGACLRGQKPSWCWQPAELHTGRGCLLRVRLMWLVPQHHVLRPLEEWAGCWGALGQFASSLMCCVLH